MERSYQYSQGNNERDHECPKNGFVANGLLSLDDYPFIDSIMSRRVRYIHPFFLRIGHHARAFGVAVAACRLLEDTYGNAVAVDLFDYSFVFDHEVLR